MLGATGVGKSSLCNLLCGNSEAFEVNDGYDSVTQETQVVSFRYTNTNKELQFEIIDSPGFFDTNIVLQKINKVEAFARDIEKCIDLTKSGISVFLFVIPVGRLLPSYHKSIQFMRDYFNKDASNHVIFVFSKCRGQSVDTILQRMRSNSGKRGLATDLVLNYLSLIDNKCVSSECYMSDDNKRQCRDKILSKIYDIHAEHGLFYRNVMWEAFQEQKRRYKRMSYKYYTAVLTGGVLAVGMGLKYYSLHKKQEETEARNDAVLNILTAVLIKPSFGREIVQSFFSELK